MNLLDIVTVSVGSLITILQAIQSNFTTKPRIIYDNFIILIMHVFTMVLVVRHYPHIHSLYRGIDKSLPRPTSRCILFDGENISFDVMLLYSRVNALITCM